jgi:hypothetical protein
MRYAVIRIVSRIIGMLLPKIRWVHKLLCLKATYEALNKNTPFE